MYIKKNYRNRLYPFINNENAFRARLKNNISLEEQRKSCEKFVENERYYNV